MTTSSDSRTVGESRPVTSQADPAGTDPQVALLADLVEVAAQEEPSAQRVIRSADTAMYQAKRNGGGAHVFTVA